MTAIIEKIRNVENDLDYIQEGWRPRDYLFKHQVVFRDSETNKRFVKHVDISDEALGDGAAVVQDLIQSMLDKWLERRRSDDR